MKKKATVLLICGMVVSLSVLSLLLPDRLFSAREKRKLQQWPEFSVGAMLDGSWEERLEAYTLDQFPFRDSWITLKKVTDRLSGRQEAGNVYLAEDGYLIDTFHSPDMEQFRRNVESLGNFLGQLEVPASVLLVPTAAAVLEDRLPPFAPTADQQAMLDQAARQLPLVQVLEVLKAHPEQQLYYRTDHHYTSLGAWYCYQAWRQDRGLPPEDPADWTREVLCRDFYGTTYQKAGLPWIRPDTITAWYRQDHPVTYNGTDREPSLYHRQALEGQDRYGVFLNSNQALSVIEGGGEGNLLLIKDSFGNTFAQFAAEEFRQVHGVDLRFFRQDLSAYIRENGITRVLVLYGLENFAQDKNLSF